MVLAGEAFGRAEAKGGAAAIATIGVVIVGGNHAAGLGDKDTARLQVVLQQVEGVILPYAYTWAVEAQQ